MKLVLAYIKSHKVAEVSRALRALPVSGMTIAVVRGWGKAKREAQKTDHAAQISDFEEHTRVEVACSDAFVIQVTGILEQVAHTGLPGDGRIFVLSLEEAINIGTGARGEGAC